MEEQSSDSLSLETKLTNMLQYVQPPESHDLHMQCIFRVQQTLRGTNPKAYTPQTVSIGPFHKPRDVGNEDNILVSTEELKLKYFKGFFIRTQVPVDNFVVELRKLEEEIRSCYEGRIKHDSNDFLQMILIDACFIIELFLRWNAYHGWYREDPLLRKPMLKTEIMMDLILLENQLPFFVLERLYNLAGMSRQRPSFLDISFEFFEPVINGTVCPTESPKHFTDLLRTCLIISSKFHLKEHGECNEIKHLYSASQILDAGLKFKVISNGSIVDLTYSEPGVLTMPFICFNDGTETVFRNIMAFELCSLKGTGTIRQYMKILDFLINTEKDVSVLVDKKIIENSMGDANAVATMVNSLCSNILDPYFDSQYSEICKSLNGFYENPRNKYKAIFIHEYFNTPWKIASTIAAIVLLLLTLIQTICSTISLF